ncbi:MAG TPA: SDR family oxidoreductase [Rhodocyclaceae bacterium]|nr:SDR family oxidoreductase [Rhodocyclaceae bacterium]
MAEKREDSGPKACRRYAPDLLAGKVALVTGGGTGMGKATALEMARCGAKLAILGRRKEILDAAVDELCAEGAEALSISCDIRVPDSIQQAMDAIRARFGRLDILVNNAGGQFVSPAREISNKGFEAVIRNNLLGTWYVTKAAADNFFFEQGGRVICVTAVTRCGNPGFAHTIAARGGVTALMKTLAIEWAEYGILINCVAPGTIKTEAFQQYPIPEENWHIYTRNLLGRPGSAQEVANAIVFLASPLADFVTGEDWYIDGGETLHLAHDAREMIDPVRFRARRPARGLDEL